MIPYNARYFAWVQPVKKGAVPEGGFVYFDDAKQVIAMNAVTWHTTRTAFMFKNDGPPPKLNSKLFKEAVDVEKKLDALKNMSFPSTAHFMLESGATSCTWVQPGYF